MTSVEDMFPATINLRGREFFVSPGLLDESVLCVEFSDGGSFRVVLLPILFAAAKTGGLSKRSEGRMNRTSRAFAAP